MSKYTITNRSAFIVLLFTFLQVGTAIAQQSFEQVLATHLDAIKNADLVKFEPTVADSVTHITPMGEMNKSKQKFMLVHEQWFGRTNWEWEGAIVEKYSTPAMGYALIKYTYTEKNAEGKVSFKIKSYLTLIFSKTGKGWQLVYDQNTMIPG